MRAYKLSKRAARVGFDFEHAGQTADKVAEELAEVRERRRTRPRTRSARCGRVARKSSRRSAICCSRRPIWRASSMSMPRRRCAPPTPNSNGDFAAWKRLAAQRGEAFADWISRRKRGCGKKSSVASEARPAARAARHAAGLQHSRSADRRAARGDLQALRRHQVLIVAGDTGSGKSTQLPQYCLRVGPRASPAYRAHAAAAARGARPGGAHRRGTAAAGRAQRGFPRALRRPGVRRHAPGADDRRAAAGGTRRPIRCCAATTPSSSTRRTSARSTSICCSAC